jgi:CRP-like cAMP-binding protein/SAM-dependent methyltransferase
MAALAKAALMEGGILMHRALALLQELQDSDIDWIVSAGGEQSIYPGTTIIHEGQHPDSLYLVLEGLLGVFLASYGDQPLSLRGLGEIVGELSFLEGQPATASVRALEPTLLLVLSRALLDSKLHADPAFAARFYRSLAMLIAQRFREKLTLLGRGGAAALQPADGTGELLGQLSQAVDRFKQLLAQADREAATNDNAVPDTMVERIEHAFRDVSARLQSVMADTADIPGQFKEEIGARVQRELLPYLLLTNAAERWYSKPRGYAGDFLTIEMIYQNQPAGTGRLGHVLDRCFLNLPAAIAVRNRRALLAEEITTVVAQKRGAAAHITSLACGPAAELFDVFAQLEDRTRVVATLIDIDLQALAFVGDRRDKTRLQRQMRLINANLIYLATGRHTIDLREQDLIYSIGLIDYFSDKFVVKLLNYIYDGLRPGGKVILGNFHPRNPTKPLMDYVLDWELIHRTEADMDRLFRSSAFNQPSTKIRYENQGINLFAECIKAPAAAEA